MLAEVYSGETATLCAPCKQDKTRGKECWLNLERLWFLFDAKKIIQFASLVTPKDVSSSFKCARRGSMKDRYREGALKAQNICK